MVHERSRPSDVPVCIALGFFLLDLNVVLVVHIQCSLLVLIFIVIVYILPSYETFADLTLTFLMTRNVLLRSFLFELMLSLFSTDPGSIGLRKSRNANLY